ncbi:MAG: hypothetical protein ACI92C_002284, partial [Neolewinella sp.]
SKDVKLLTTSTVVEELCSEQRRKATHNIYSGRGAVLRAKT